VIASVNLYSNIKGEINKFLSKFYDTDLQIQNSLKWEKEYKNPIEIAEIVGAFIDNNEKYKINMWICLDNGIFINVTNNNANEIIKYLYERFPY
jgi:hypothetical protein